MSLESNRRYFRASAASNRCLNKSNQGSSNEDDLTVSTIQIHIFENVQNWKDLSIIRNQCFAYHISRYDQMLQNLKNYNESFWISGNSYGMTHTFNVVQITGRQRVFNAFLIGMISCGITGRIFEPPCSSMSWTPWRAKNSYGCVVSLKKWTSKFWKSHDRVQDEECTILTKGHQRRVVNSDDNQVFRFQPSMLFCFLLCRVLMQLGNHLVRKIFEMQLVLKY